MNIKSINTKRRIIRAAVLAASAAFFLFFSKVVSEHAICPIGGFELFFNGIFRSGFSIAGLFSGMVIIFLIMSVLSIIFRRAYCGYICPMGAMQEFFEFIGKKVLPQKIRDLKIPRKIDSILRWAKYAVLASFIAGAAFIGGHWMIAGDPFIVMMGLFNGNGLVEMITRHPAAFLFFISILVYALFFGRGFCKYICPAGAWYAILSKISPNKVTRCEENCINCGRCSKSCPMDIDVANLTKVTSAECIGCHECVNSCPAPGALSAPIGPVKIPSGLVPLAAAAVFSGSVYLSTAITPQRDGSHDFQNGSDTPDATAYSTDSSDDSQDVSFGGCASCIGCGLCKSV